MATLQKIRNKSWLLLTVIGIAMLAFILGDLFKSTNTSRNSIYIGEIFGEDILRQDFEIKLEEGIENWKSQNQQTTLTQTITGQIRDQIWDQYIKELIMENEFEKLGVAVSDDEFFELLQGVNVHSEISKIPTFQNPETGEFDRTRVLAYLKQIDQDQTGEARERWIGFQKYLIGLIKNSKYNSLVSKAMYTTKEEAIIDLNSNNLNATFNYVSIPYTSVSDEDVLPTDAEIKNYYNNHKNDYKQTASKDVDFVVYTVVPSVEDDESTKLAITELVEDFKIYEDYNLMVRRNSDNTNSKFLFAKKDVLEDKEWETLFNSEKGSVIGPYLSSPGVYRIAKLVDIQNRADSVEARHILITPTKDMNIDSVYKRLESLKLAVEKGADFGDLAQVNSDDKGSSIKGGDLGWFKEGAMVDEFNEACFTSNKGDLSIVKSQFGVHLIEVTKLSRKVKKVKIAYIDRLVEPSTETYNMYYSQAAQFTGKILNEGIPFDTLVAQNNLVKRSDKKVSTNKQSITGLPNSREIVRWMNDSKTGDISEIFQIDNSYVVAYLTNEHKEGVVSLENLREQIASLVVKEKKVANIISSITNSDLSSVATSNSVKVVYDQKATLANLNIQGIGYEPELVGSIFATDIGVTSKPIAGNNAVYLVEVTSLDDPKINVEFNQQKNQIQRQDISYALSAYYKALKEAANIKDNRSDFY